MLLTAAAAAPHRDRRRPPGRLALAAVWLSVALAAAACSGQGEDADPDLGSQTTQAPDTEGSDRQAGDGTGADADGGSGSTETSTETSNVVPTSVFQRLPAAQFANASPELAVADAAALDDGTWLVVGSLEDGRRRSLDATVAVLDPGSNDNSTGTGRRVALPDGGADRSQAGGLALAGDRVLVVGSVERADRAEPVLWIGDRSLDRWLLIQLPTTGDPVDASAVGVYHRLDSSYVIGRSTVDGFERPLVWRADGAGGVWRQLDVVAPGGDQSGFGDGADVSASAASIADQGLVMIGRSLAATGDPTPLVWVERNDRLVPAEADGLPLGGSLHDLATADDGSLVAVGAATEAGVSTPILASASGPDGRWTVRRAELDLAGWVSFDGVEFGRLMAENGAIYATLTNPVVQQLYRSDDDGRSWQRLGNLSLAGNNFVPARAVSRSSDGSILVVGADVAMVWVGSDWSLVTDPEALPTQLGALQAIDVVAGERGFLIGGGRTARTDSELRFEAVLWQSPDGSRWGRPPIDQPVGFVVNDVFHGPDGDLAAFKAGGSYFTPVHLLRPDPSGRWQSTPMPVGEAFLDHSLAGVNGAIVAAGNRPRSDLSQTDPLFAIVEPDGALREVPLTNSPIGDANASVLCLAGAVGQMIAVLEWGDGEIGVATGTNGERWRGIDSGNDLDGLSIRACHGDGDGFLLGGRDVGGRAVVARSEDGQRWTVEPVADTAAVLGIDRIDGRLYLSGWRSGDGDPGRTATIWAPASNAGGDGDGGGDGPDVEGAVKANWLALTDLGFDGDDFARFTELTGLAATDDVVVAIGSDRGRAGAWVATIDALTGG